MQHRLITTTHWRGQYKTKYGHLGRIWNRNGHHKTKTPELSECFQMGYWLKVRGNYEDKFYNSVSAS